ncbi:MAG: PEP-CTERM sorting domain-containing protein [bacterium]|nr:PEP-CTERM sorting domain-containing protein [bacterium]
MRIVKLLAILGAILVFSTSAYAVVDVVEFPTGYFCPDEASTYDSPYYRWYNEDWGWSHNVIGGTITSATLNISAWDVDANASYDPEVDNIYAYDSGSWTFLGSLVGLDNSWGYSTFTLGSNFYDDIASGLQVRMDIDSTHSYDYWAVTLAKSALTVNGGTLPNPNPGAPVPEPGTFMLLGSGLVGLIGYGKVRFGKKA